MIELVDISFFLKYFIFDFMYVGYMDLKFIKMLRYFMKFFFKFKVY